MTKQEIKKKILYKTSQVLMAMIQDLLVIYSNIL